LAVGEVLVERGHEVMIFISEKEVDALAIRGRTEFRFETLPSIGLPKLFSPAVLGFLWRFNQSLTPCRKLFASFRPDAVLGMGGFTSTAPILAGRGCGARTYLHESNAIPGKANRLNALLVQKVLLGMPACERHFRGKPCVVTGTPIRRSLRTRIPQAEALAAFGLQPGRTTVLVMGGSQGARGINHAMRAAAAELRGEPIQILHLTGAQEEAATREAYQACDLPAHVAAFCHTMELAYSAADLAVARSGAASLSELAAFGLPSVLIPYPHAAENHQQLNAETAVQAGAAFLLKESDATGPALARMIRALAHNPDQTTAMRQRAETLSPHDAAERVASLLITGP
jgi:UDP-N-acetylglucosamine--N-acetylmuramyl-(pentapeptide) pyrophosphoryl-undecaprenol N-acetylglucosamine transferase